MLTVKQVAIESWCAVVFCAVPDIVSHVSVSTFRPINQFINNLLHDDRRGRLVGEAWVPKAGLTGHEFQLYVRHLAVEADRFEYRLTGRDFE